MQPTSGAKAIILLSCGLNTGDRRTAWGNESTRCGRQTDAQKILLRTGKSPAATAGLLIFENCVDVSA